MFYKYEIINNGKEDILYLYLTMKYEFSKELTINSDDNDLSRRTKNFISTNSINFNGKRVYLIVDGIIVKSLDISEVKQDIKRDLIYSCDNFLINIKDDDNSIFEITLREYLTSVLLYNYSYNVHDEVLKAIVVLYNTYAYKMMRDNNFIYSDDSFFNYVDPGDYKNTYQDYEKILLRINAIITEVDCTFLSYENDYILPFIHYSNSGRTLSNNCYPYLSSVKSLWDITSPYFVEVKNFSYTDLGKLLNMDINSKSTIEIFGKNSLKKVKFDNKLFSIEEIRKLLDLKSTDIYIIIYNNYLKVITQGYGSSYGLSLFGSNEIANNGAKYYNILNYYFPKTKLFKYIKELSN